MKTHFCKFVWLFLFLCNIIASVKAQNGRFYSTDHGLSSSLINQLYQDSRGYLWGATEHGLNKFDGISFSTFLHTATDGTTIKNNYVRTLFEDRHRHLWVGCIDGLMRYDSETDTFHEIPMMRNGRQVYPHVTQLCELHNGDVWISTSGQGMFCLDELGNSARSLDSLLLQANYNFQTKVFEDSYYHIWIGTEGNGLIRYLPETNETQIFKYPVLSGNNVSALLEDKDGTLFVGVQGQGMMKYHRQTGMFEEIPYDKGGRLSVDCMALVNGRLLIGTDGQGLKVYRKEKQQIEDYIINTAPLDFREGKIHSILSDKEDNLWLGLFQKGIVFIPKSENTFEYYGNKSIHYNPIGQGCVMAVCQDHNDHLWIGADNEGLFELDAGGRRLRHYEPTGKPHSVANTIMCIYVDSDDNLWIGSYMQGAGRLDPTSGRCEYLSQIGSEKVLSIVEDKQKNLYIATLGSGFYQYNLKTQTLKHYESSKDEKGDLKRNELPNDYINYMYCDSKGIMWIGHYQGVSCFNPMTGSFLNDHDTNMLIKGCIGYAFMEDRQGNIWMGTTDGLYCYHKDTGTIEHFTAADGLSNDVVCGICEDEKQRVWVSTYMGISCYDRTANRFVNYYAGDGLQGNEFTHGAFFKNKSGKIYFGGVNGVTGFWPQTFGASSDTMDVWVTGFYIHNQPVHKNTLSGGQPVIDTSVQNADIFRLSHSDNTFSIQFSTLDFNNPEQIFYRYKMEGLGNNWQTTAPGDNRVTYNNLAPGTYTFSVQASNHGNYSTIRSVQIQILPPWYRTWWAYTVYMGLFLILIMGIVNYMQTRARHRKELMIREHAEQLNEAKLQFFINISHEIRTPMTLIISPLEKLIAEKRNPEKHQTYLMIYRNAQRILRLINQLMDIRKLDKGQMHMKFSETDIVAFINDLMLTFDYLAKKKHIRFTFEHAMEQLPVWVDLNNFDKVLMNLLSNAFKYTPDDGEIQVRLSTGNDTVRRDSLKNYVEISITDTGIGINKDQIERIFERFYQIDNDVTQSNFGAGIGLHLSRSLVQLHHGVLFAENREEGSGSRFVIRIPQGAAHLRADELEQIENTELAVRPLSVKPKKAALVDTIEENGIEVKKVKPKTRIKVAVVEDEEEIRSYLQSELADDYLVQTFSNGKEAYERILIDTPDLLISDVMMPDMDGLTLCRKLKQHPLVNHVPVVLLTAKSKPEDRLEGMETGADAYMVKPFDIELLKHTIANLITNRSMLRNKFTGTQQQADKQNKIVIKSGDEKLMAKIMKVVNEHLADSDFSVEKLAYEVGLSRVHIHRKLKELTNQSARDFIRNVRLQQAASLLASEQRLTVSEIAYAVGYTNLSHFSTSFKEMYGVSPKEYMERMKN